MRKAVLSNIARALRGVQAGILISIGGAVYLTCYGEDLADRTVGAVFFSVALLCICKMGYLLYTGKIGYMVERHDGEAFAVLLWGLFGNIVSTALMGAVIRAAIPNAGDTSAVICAVKLAQSPLQTLVCGALCGVLMYLAVSIYRNSGGGEGIVFCVPAFILAGFEHSIADAFYFAAAGMTFEPRAWGYLAVTLIGNTVGALVLPLTDAACRAERKK